MSKSRGKNAFLKTVLSAHKETSHHQVLGQFSGDTQDTNAPPLGRLLKPKDAKPLFLIAAGMGPIKPSRQHHPQRNFPYFHTLSTNSHRH